MHILAWCSVASYNTTQHKPTGIWAPYGAYSTTASSEPKNTACVACCVMLLAHSMGRWLRPDAGRVKRTADRHNASQRKFNFACSYMKGCGMNLICILRPSANTQHGAVNSTIYAAMLRSHMVVRTNALILSAKDIRYMGIVKTSGRSNFEQNPLLIPSEVSESIGTSNPGSDLDIGSYLKKLIN